MPKVAKVVLEYDDGTTRELDPDRVDSIFFDDEKAKCFASWCLSEDRNDPESRRKAREKVEQAIDGRGRPGGGGGNPGTGSSDRQAGPTATATADTAVQTLTGAAFECIHETNCNWDCGTA